MARTYHDPLGSAVPVSFERVLGKAFMGGGLPPHDGSIAWCADLEFERYSIAMLEGTEMLDMPSSPTREPGCA